MVSRKVLVLGGTAALLLLTSCTVAAMLLSKQQRRKRRFKTRPINRTRDTDGHYASLVHHLLYTEEDDEQYFKYTRMTPAMFEYLLGLTAPYLQKDKTKQPLSPAHQLTMTLNYLACGGSMQSIAWNYRVGKTTVHCVIRKTCEVLWDVLMPIVLQPPTEERWLEIAGGFAERWQMPNCLGAIDGKHIVIEAPHHSGSQYFNYKKSFSIVLMAMCDWQYRFTFVDVGACGSNHDSVVFSESTFGTAILNETLHFPPATVLPHTIIPMEYFTVADQAFPLHKRIMRPFPGQYLGERKNIFNYRLSRARRTIENTFGILVQRWRILRSPLCVSVDMCERITLAAIVLHNFVQDCESRLPQEHRKYCPPGFADASDGEHSLQLGTWRQSGMGTGLVPLPLRRSTNARRTTHEARNVLADYFTSAQGAVPWQLDYILRGSVPDTFT